MTYPVAEEQDEPAPHVPVKKKRTGLIVLTVVTTVLLGATGALGFLYFDSKARGASLTTELADLEQRRLAAIGKQLDGNDLLAKARTAENTAEDAQEKAELTGRKMADCQEAARAVRQADLGGADQAAFEAAALKMFATC
jgi:hypothetical protein